MKCCAVVVLGLLLSPIALAQYRCVENGKSLFIDKPCASNDAPSPSQGNSPKVIGNSAKSAYSTSYGDWRGQVQYQATYQGKPLSEDHAVVQTTVSIDPQGKILGSSPENGCKMKGIASPGMAPTILNLNITLAAWIAPCSVNENGNILANLSLARWSHIVTTSAFSSGVSSNMHRSGWRH